MFARSCQPPLNVYFCFPTQAEWNHHLKPYVTCIMSSFWSSKWSSACPERSGWCLTPLFAHDGSPPCLAVIRQCQPGASWPRFTALWLCCQQGFTTTPGICNHNTYRRNTLLYSAHNSSQRIFLALIILNTEIHALLNLLRTVCLSSAHCIVLPSYMVVRFLCCESWCIECVVGWKKAATWFELLFEIYSVTFIGFV